MVLVNRDREKKEVDVKGFIPPLLRTFALAVVIFIVMWVLNYIQGQGLNVPVVQALKDFLYSSWYIIVGFVLLISVWEYAYPIYYIKLKYVSPAIQSISLLFGLWLVVVFLWGLTSFTSASPEIGNVLVGIANFFYNLYMLIFILFLLVTYANFFLREKEREEE